MEGLTIYYLLVVSGIFLSSCSQLLLKKSASHSHSSYIASLLNWRVIFAYTILLSSMVINITALGKGVGLKELPILESLGYVFVPLLSFFVLKEKITARMLVSISFILMGIYIFYL